MGRVVHAEYVCDFCGKAIGETEALIGRLTLRKAGVRGLGRSLEVVLHDACSEKLTRHAAPVTARRKAASKA
jgi:hypothetical protein